MQQDLWADEETVTASMAVLEPFAQCLERAWTLPMLIGNQKDLAEMQNMAIMLSYRGSERQRPSCLQLSLRFSATCVSQEALHVGLSQTERLGRVIKDYNNSKGVPALVHVYCIRVWVEVKALKRFPNAKAAKRRS